MTHQTFSVFFVIGGYMIFFHKSQNNIQNFPVHRHPQGAVPVGDDLMGPPGIKSGNQFSVFISSHWKLGLVPIMERMLHPRNGLHHLLQELLGKTADPPQVVLHFSLLKRKLLFIGKRLDLAAAALTVKSADRLHRSGEAFIISTIRA